MATVASILSDSLLLFSLDIVKLIIEFLIYPSPKYGRAATALKILGIPDTEESIQFITRNANLGDIWIGTRNTIFIYNIDSVFVRSFPSPRYQITHAIFSDNQLLLAWTNSVCYNSILFARTTLSTDQSEIKSIDVVDSPLLTFAAFSIAVSRDTRTIFIHANNCWIYSFDSQTKQCERFIETSPSATQIQLNPAQTEIFLLSRPSAHCDSMKVYDAANGRFLRDIPGVCGNVFALDHKSNIFVATFQNVCVFDPNGGLLVDFDVESVSITALCVDLYGRLYIGDISGHVSVYAFL